MSDFSSLVCGIGLTSRNSLLHSEAPAESQPTRQCAKRRESHPLKLVISVIALGLASLLVSACTNKPNPGWNVRTVSGVAVLRAQLERAPRLWLGHDVRVRAAAEPCLAWGSLHSALHCHAPAPNLADSAGADLAEPLPLVFPEDRVGRFLRRMPVLSLLARPAPSVQWDRLITYRIRLVTIAARLCGESPCYAALLLGQG